MCENESEGSGARAQLFSRHDCQWRSSSGNFRDGSSQQSPEADIGNLRSKVIGFDDSKTPFVLVQMPLVARRDDLGKNTCVMNDETGWGFPQEPPAETVIPLSGFKTIDCPNEVQSIAVERARIRETGALVLVHMLSGHPRIKII